MTPELAVELRALVARARVLALGVLVEGAPHVGFLPYAPGEDGTVLFVHASRLARHTQGMLAGADFSALIQQPDPGQGDPAQLARVTLHGRIRPLARNTDPWAEAHHRYLERFPASARTFELGDFTLYALHAESGRYVAGFAQAADVRPEDLRAS